MLFVHVGKNSSETLRTSRSQIFFKIGVLKNFSMFAKKHLCASLFLIKLHARGPALLSKKRFQRRCFPVNNAPFLRTAFLWNTFCSLHLFVLIEFFGRLWVQNWRFSYFLYYCLESGIHTYLVLVFIPKILVSLTFARITTSAPPLF